MFNEEVIIDVNAHLLVSLNFSGRYFSKNSDSEFYYFDVNQNFEIPYMYTNEEDIINDNLIKFIYEYISKNKTHIEKEINLTNLIKSLYPDFENFYNNKFAYIKYLHKYINEINENQVKDFKDTLFDRNKINYYERLINQSNDKPYINVNLNRIIEIKLKDK